MSKLNLNNRLFFNGEKIEITIVDIDFDEFYNIYNRWRYGLDLTTNEQVPSRGFINVKVNNQVISIYPIGSNAFEYERGFRELTIRGKIKNRQ